MVIHELKTWPEYYAEVAAGTKTFEIRKDDREFSTADAVILREWDSEKGQYTGRLSIFRVGYVLRGGPFLPLGYCAFSILTVGPFEAIDIKTRFYGSGLDSDKS